VDAATADARPGRPDSGPPVDAAPGIDALVPTPDANPAFGTLIISEILDGTLPNGLPKFVELTNIGDSPVDLEDWSIGVYSNGNGTLSTDPTLVLSTTLASCASYVVSLEGGDGPGDGTFFDVYGEDPDDFGLGAATNGDDVVALFFTDGSGPDGAATGDGSDATLVDVFGVIGVDGTDSDWEYTDSFAVRRPGTSGPNPVFDTNEWAFGVDDLFDPPNNTAGFIAGSTSPGSHNSTPCGI